MNLLKFKNKNKLLIKFMNQNNILPFLIIIFGLITHPISSQTERDRESTGPL